MTDKQKQQILELYNKWYGKTDISKQLNISINTIKSFFKRNDISRIEIKKVKKHGDRCLYCDAEIEQTPHKRIKKFCSDKCRMTWWKEHRECINRKSAKVHICLICGKEFKSYADRKSAHVYATEGRKEYIIMKENLIKYQTVMAWVRPLLAKDIISRQEYSKIDTMMLKKYGVSPDSIYR